MSERISDCTSATLWVTRTAPAGRAPRMIGTAV